MGRTGRYRILPIFGTGFLILGMLLLSRLAPDTSGVVFGVSLACVGAGMGFIFPVVTTAVQNAVPREQLGTATASGLMFRQVGGSLAVAVFGAVFASRLTSRLGGVIDGVGESMQVSPKMLAEMPDAARIVLAEGVVASLQPIYLIAAALGVIGLLFAFALREIPLTNRMVPKSE
jgi:MFS family permease